MAKISIAGNFSCEGRNPLGTCSELAANFINYEAPQQLENYTCNALSVNNHKALLVICSGEKKKVSSKKNPQTSPNKPPFKEEVGEGGEVYPPLPKGVPDAPPPPPKKR